MDYFNQLVNDVDIYQVIKAFQTETFAKLNVMRIGVIDEILADNEVRCSITNKKLIKTNPDGTSTWRDYPPIFAKVWYMGSGASGIDYPLTIGTPCLLLFNDREFDSYFTSKKVSSLANTLMHDLSYCVAIPLYQASNDNKFNIKSNVNMSITAPLITNTGNTVIVGTLKPTNYLASDSSPGITTTQIFKDGAGVNKTMTIKNGIITSIT